MDTLYITCNISYSGPQLMAILLLESTPYIFSKLMMLLGLFPKCC